MVTVVVGEKEWGNPATTWDHEESVELGAMAEAEVDTETDAGVTVMERAGVATSTSSAAGGACGTAAGGGGAVAPCRVRSLRRAVIGMGEEVGHQ